MSRNWVEEGSLQLMIIPTWNFASGIGSWGQDEKWWRTASPWKKDLQVKVTGRRSPVLFAAPVWSGIFALLSWEGGGGEWSWFKYPRFWLFLQNFIDFSWINIYSFAVFFSTLAEALNSCTFMSFSLGNGSAKLFMLSCQGFCIFKM